MKSIQFALVFVLIISATACGKIPTLDDVIPDTRTTYRKSRTLPDLEVPPDLTLDQEDNLKIPGEAEPTTLTAFQRQQKRGGMSELEMLAQQYPGEKVLPLPGRSTDIWPELLSYFSDNQYQIELEDAELGVLETAWLDKSAGDGKYRVRYKIFAEPAEDGKNSIIFVSSERQGKIELGDGTVEWVDELADDEGEKQVVAEIKEIFYGDMQLVETGASSESSTWSEPEAATVSDVKRAIVTRSVDEKIYLEVPEEFASTWQMLEQALGQGLFYLEDKDPEKGLFFIVYTEEEPEAGEKKEGWLSKLKFWGDDEASGTNYQISLTGVGDQTEVVILNDSGDWVSNRDADRILTALMDEYNR